MIYNCFDVDAGRIISTFNNVAAARLTGGVLSVGSAAVTVDSTDGLWPGMLVVGKGIPAATVVLSVDSATTFSLSVVATAAVTGGVIVARGYIPATVVATLNVETYRDIFSSTSSFGVVGGGGSLMSTNSLNSVGSALYITDPTVTTVVLGVNSVPVVSGTVNATQSDQFSHTPPRENVQKIDEVFFVCTDGAICPAVKLPNFHFCQAEVLT